MKYEFWKDWKRKTKLEEEAIEVVKKGKKILLTRIPKQEIVSIYLKGSLARRELTKRSDIDFVVILRNSKFISRLKKIEGDYERKFALELEVRGYTLQELKTGKRIKNISSTTPPYRFVKHLQNFKLIYGKDLKNSKLFKRSDKRDLITLVKHFKKSFLPMYEKKKIGFSDIVKQIFWLTENEQRLEGKDPPNNWKKLAKSIKNKDYIIHDALKYRLKPTKDKKERARFIKKLEMYLTKLNKEL